jgi:hypothetical protein
MKVERKNKLVCFLPKRILLYVKVREKSIGK